jgi:hypothetical protein
MGMIINIDQALKERSHYNVLKEPLHEMMKAEQEAWEKENPIDLLFVRGTISSFQETYTSSIGFAHAFTETSDFNIGPIFNQAEGFTATYRTKTFQGSFIITQQTLEDGQYGRVKDEASAFGKRWRGDVVEYAMKSIEGGFGIETTWTAGDGKVSRIKLDSADTVDGDINNPVKNPLFTNAHKTVKRDDVAAKTQTNLYYLDIDLNADTYNKVSVIASAINEVITGMENLLDDNGKITGVNGAKDIVTANNPHLNAVINTALSMDMFKYGDSDILNVAKNRGTHKSTAYLNEICNGKCIFIVDKAYNKANHGLEFTERIPFTLDATELKRPNGIAYDGRQRFDVNTATWRGIACIYLGNPAKDNLSWAKEASMFTKLEVGTAISMPVTVTNASEIGA